MNNTLDPLVCWLLRGAQGQQVLPWLQLMEFRHTGRRKDPLGELFTQTNKMAGRGMLTSCSGEQKVVLTVSSASPSVRMWYCIHCLSELAGLASSLGLELSEVVGFHLNFTEERAYGETSLWFVSWLPEDTVLLK